MAAVASALVLDEIARVGFEGTQLGVDFPEGAALREALRELFVAVIPRSAEESSRTPRRTSG